MMKKILVFFISVSALFTFAGDVQTYAGIWQLRANPLEHVTVVFQDGSKVTGTLSREWSQMWTLTAEDRTRYFQMTDMKEMGPGWPKDPDEFPWRRILPLWLYFSVGITALIGLLRGKQCTRLVP